VTEVVSLASLEQTPHARVFPDAEPRTVRLDLSAGTRVAGHTHPGRRVVFYLVEGAVDLRVGDETHALEPGDVARFDGDREVEPTATADSTALVVLARAPAVGRGQESD